MQSSDGQSNARGQPAKGTKWPSQLRLGAWGAAPEPAVAAWGAAWGWVVPEGWGGLALRSGLGQNPAAVRGRYRLRRFASASSCRQRQ